MLISTLESLYEEMAGWVRFFDCRLRC